MGASFSFRAVVLAAALVAAVSACGGSGSSNGGSSGGTSASGGQLTAQVSNPGVQVQGKYVIATTKVKIGGKAGQHLTLDWGLIDAIQNAESQPEAVVKHFVTTSAVVTHDVTLKVKKPAIHTPYLIHFVLYAPDGSELSSADTDEFNGG